MIKSLKSFKFRDIIKFILLGMSYSVLFSKPAYSNSLWDSFTYFNRDPGNVETVTKPATSFRLVGTLEDKRGKKLFLRGTFEKKIEDYVRAFGPAADLAPNHTVFVRWPKENETMMDLYLIELEQFDQFNPEQGSTGFPIDSLPIFEDIVYSLEGFGDFLPILESNVSVTLIDDTIGEEISDLILVPGATGFSQIAQFRVPSEAVEMRMMPEHSATSSLLAFGIFGAVLVQRRKKKG